MRLFCIPVTDEPVSMHAARAALNWCRQLGASALMLNVVTVPPLHRSQNPDQVRQSLKERSQHFLETWQTYARHQGQTLETLSVVQDGRGVAQTINDTASSKGCDVIAMGTHGLGGVNRFLLGSVAEAVVRHATLPVLLFRQGIDPQPLRRLMVAVDGSLGSDLAVQTTRDLAAQTAASVQVLHVTPDPLVPVNPARVNVARDAFEQNLIRAGKLLLEHTERALPGVELRASLMIPAAFRRIDEVILEAARDQQADLLVLGTQGRGGVERLLLGSVAEAVARHATLPVMLVRGSLEALKGVKPQTFHTEFTARDDTGQKLER
jgi:nucleotide-binding universal stress UspA family protein